MNAGTDTNSPALAANPPPSTRCGIDTVEIARIEKLLRDTAPEDLRRFFSEQEIADAGEGPGRAASLAARFAAKEAVSKCFTTGIGTEFGWKSASVYHGSRHEPLVRLDAQGEALLAHVGATHVMLTLSHTENYAMAVAALVRA